jgi:hypothetical protein
MHYEVVDLRTNRVLLSTTDRDEAERACYGFVADGRSWHDLDLVEVAEDQRHSVLVRIHESPLRKSMAEHRGQTYRWFYTLAEAQAAPVAAVSVEGDYGGQIYATCPAKLVQCTEERLYRLAEELEAELWATDYLGTVQVLYEPLPVGAGIAGGKGGGLIIDGSGSTRRFVRSAGQQPSKPSYSGHGATYRRFVQKFPTKRAPGSCGRTTSESTCSVMSSASRNRPTWGKCTEMSGGGVSTPLFHRPRAIDVGIRPLIAPSLARRADHRFARR